ncbi:MAG: hypothetical protein IKK10_00920 [Clostridia bacterium]|nr:hypothetical protein [Clostridia bacterium]
MLKALLTDINGRVTEETPMSIVMDIEDDVPADSVTLKIKGMGFPVLTKVELFREGTLVFSGEIDEQTEIFGKKSYTEVIARDSSARLIDSEAYPMSFVNPSAKDIFDRYAKPFGFKELKGENRIYSGRFTVEKGISCYTAIRRFAMALYSVFPKCRGDELFIEGVKSEDVLEFGKNGIPVLDMRVVHLRCNRVSRVYFKYKDGEGYNTFVSDAGAENQGINKVRYINLASDGSSVKDADIIFDEAKKKSFYADVVCRGFLGDALGKTVLLTDNPEEYYVTSVRYTADEKGEYTKLRILKKEE